MKRKLKEYLLREASLKITRFIDKAKYVDALKNIVKEDIQWNKVLNRWNNVITLLLLYAMEKNNRKVYDILIDDNIRKVLKSENPTSVSDTLRDYGIKDDFEKFAKDCIVDTLHKIKVNDIADGTDECQIKDDSSLGNVLVLADAFLYYNGSRIHIKNAMEKFKGFLKESNKSDIREINKWTCFRFGTDWVEYVLNPMDSIYTKFTFFVNGRNVLPDEEGFNRNAKLNLVSFHINNNRYKIVNNQTISGTVSSKELLSSLTNEKSKEFALSIKNLLKDISIPSKMRYKTIVNGQETDTEVDVNLSLKDVNVLPTEYENTCGVVCKFSQSITEQNGQVIKSGHIISSQEFNTIEKRLKSILDISNFKTHLIGGDIYISFIPTVKGINIGGEETDRVKSQKLNGKTWYNIISDSNDEITNTEPYINTLKTTQSLVSQEPNKTIYDIVDSFKNTGDPNISSEIYEYSLPDNLDKQLPKIILDFLKYKIQQKKEKSIANMKAIMNTFNQMNPKKGNNKTLKKFKKR